MQASKAPRITLALRPGHHSGSRLLSLALSLGLAGCASVGSQETLTAPAESSPRPETTPSAAPSVLDGIYTSSQASRGEDRFERACSTCHQINEFTGGRFRLKWVGGTLGDIYDFISTAMPDDDPGSLTPSQYVDIVAYFLSANDYPTGAEALLPDASMLRSVRIESAPN